MKHPKCKACKAPIHDTPVRGCHMACYQSLRRRVLRGEDTDADLVAAGLWLKQGKPGRKRRTF